MTHPTDSTARLRARIEDPQTPPYLVPILKDALDEIEALRLIALADMRARLDNGGLPAVLALVRGLVADLRRGGP